jgi:transposase-like protein
MSQRYPSEVRCQVVELARGTRVTRLAERFGMREAMIYNWLRQDRIDRGEEGRAAV